LNVIVSRNPNDFVRTNHLPCRCQRQIFLPNVNSVGIDRKGNIRSIIDNEEAAIPLTHIPHLLGESEEIA
jgi:hypothetical protein